VIEDGPQLRGMSDHELGNLVRDIRGQINACEVQIERRSQRRKRTIKLVRGTLLTAGGFVTATYDILAFFLVLAGLWDWIEAVAEDAEAMNRQIALMRNLRDLEDELRSVEKEFERRRP
jgi:hypothetical protein